MTYAKINNRRCGPRKGSLSAADRDRLPPIAFALSGRRYPLFVISRGEAVPDREHAVNAKARGTQQFERGNLTTRELSMINEKADATIARCDRLEGKSPSARSSSYSHAEADVLDALPAGRKGEPISDAELRRLLGGHQGGELGYPVPDSRTHSGYRNTPELERTLNRLHKAREISLEYPIEGGGERRWRRGKQVAGVRGTYTVKRYCDDGQVFRKGAATLGKARELVATERGKHEGDRCSLSIVDAQGVIKDFWTNDGDGWRKGNGP